MTFEEKLYKDLPNPVNSLYWYMYEMYHYLTMLWETDDQIGTYNDRYPCYNKELLNKICKFLKKNHDHCMLLDMRNETISFCSAELIDQNYILKKLIDFKNVKLTYNTAPSIDIKVINGKLEVIDRTITYKIESDTSLNFDEHLNIVKITFNSKLNEVYLSVSIPPELW